MNEDINRNTFEKITLLNLMTQDLVSYAAQKYGPQFFDFIDMNCGAIPEGNYENVIDKNAPEEFISLYKKIAINRFTMCCQKILELGDEYKKILTNYLTNEGKNLGLPKAQNLNEAYSLIEFCIIFPEANANPIQTPNTLCWNYLETNKTYWNHIQYFIQEILDKTKISFSIKENNLLELISE